ncbi:MAG: thymidine phosphorylase, partial [Gammaproteobacteria bacterium]
MDNKNKNTMRVKRIGIDTYRQAVIYMRHDCPICRIEGFEAFSRINVRIRERSIIATLHIIRDSILRSGELGLSDAAWEILHAQEDDIAFLSHPEPMQSLSYVRAKIHGRALEQWQFDAIIQDIVARNFDDIHLSAFIT